MTRRNDSDEGLQILLDAILYCLNSEQVEAAKLLVEIGTNAKTMLALTRGD
jgi:hypothetical protein